MVTGNNYFPLFPVRYDVSDSLFTVFYTCQTLFTITVSKLISTFSVTHHQYADDSEPGFSCRDTQISDS